MRRLSLIAVLVLLVALVAGCGSGPSASISVTGRIVDDGSPQKALKGARISLAGQTTTSASDGTFSLTAKSGSHTLTVVKSGFRPATQSVRISSSAVNLGNITLQQDIPSAGGPYAPGSGITVPEVVASSAEFDVPVSSDSSLTVALLYPRTEARSLYDYSLNVDFVGGTPPPFKSGYRSSGPRRFALKPNGLARTAGRTISRSGNPDLLTPRIRADLVMRERERRVGRDRLSILSAETQAKMRFVRSASPSQRYFYVFRFATETYEQLHATLQKSGVYADWYVSDGTRVDSAKLNNWSAWFDAIKGNYASTFGDELDVDGNGRVVFLLTPLDDTVLGYFDPRNEAPASLYSESNEADMLFVDPNALPDPEEVKGVVAHEYQHLLHFSERLRNGDATGETWINEAFSMLAMDLVDKGYLAGDLTSYEHVKAWGLYHNRWSLTDWQDEDVYVGCYGGAYLFGRYLYDQYGRSKVLEINRSPYSGTRGVTNAVGGTFEELFRSWLAATVNEWVDVTSSDPRLNYGPDFHIVVLAPDPYVPLVGVSATYPTDVLLTSANDPGEPTAEPPVPPYRAPLRPWGFELFAIEGDTGADSETKATLTLTSSSGASGNYGATVLRMW